MPDTDVKEPGRPAQHEQPSPLVVVLTVAAFALMPILQGSILWAAPGATTDPLRSVSLSLYDLPLVALVISALPTVARSHGRVGPPRSAVPLLTSTFALWALITVAVRPSWRGVDWIIHICAAAVVAWVVSDADRRRWRVLVGSFVFLAIVQGSFGVLQSLHGSTFGITLIEYSQDLLTFGSQVGGKGSFGHPYHLTTMLLIGVAAAYCLAERSDSRTNPPLLLAGAALGFALPFTYSRAMILSIAVVVPVAALARNRALRPVTTALVTGLGVAFLLTASGWSAKAEKSLGERRDSGRIELAGEALDLMADEPLFGVGPGRYVIERSEQAGVVSNPPHNAVVHAGAEMGVPGMLLVAAIFVVSGWWAIRSGALATIVWVAPIPLFLLDAFPYIFPRGIVISGFWVGLLIRTVNRSGSRHRRRDLEASEAGRP